MRQHRRACECGHGHRVALAAAHDPRAVVSLLALEIVEPLDHRLEGLGRDVLGQDFLLRSPAHATRRQGPEPPASDAVPRPRSTGPRKLAAGNRLSGAWFEIAIGMCHGESHSLFLVGLGVNLESDEQLDADRDLLELRLTSSRFAALELVFVRVTNRSPGTIISRTATIGPSSTLLRAAPAARARARASAIAFS